jgi:O-antigen/teichoic acid export membrane protein
MAKNLTHKTFHSIKWTASSTFSQIAIQLGYSTVMARLLPPSAFGIVAMTAIVLNFASFFAKMGLSQAIIQKQNLTKEEIRAAFTAGTFLGVFFYALIFSLSPFAVYIFPDVPEVVPVLRLSALSMVISGLFSTSSALLSKQLKFRQISIRNILSYIISYPVIGLILAALGFGYWSIVIASLSQALINGVASFWIARHSVLFVFKWEHYKSLFSYGSKMSLLTFIDFIGTVLGEIVIGRLLGKVKLGIYDRSKFLVELPASNIGRLISGVLFPVISSINQDKEKLRKQYYLVITFISFLIGSMSLGMMVASEPLVYVMLGNQWEAAIIIVTILSLTAPVRILLVFTGTFIDASNLLMKRFFADSVFLVTLATSFWFVQSYGVEGFAWVIVANLVFKLVLYTAIIKKHLNLSGLKIVKLYLLNLPSFAITMGMIKATLLSLSSFEIPYLPLLIICIASGGIGLMIGFIVHPNKTFKFEIYTILDKSLPISKYTFFKKLFL